MWREIGAFFWLLPRAANKASLFIFHSKVWCFSNMLAKCENDIRWLGVLRHGKPPKTETSTVKFLTSFGMLKRKLFREEKIHHEIKLMRKCSSATSKWNLPVGGDDDRKNVICCQNDSWSRTSYINAITELMACYFIQFIKSLFNASFFLLPLFLSAPQKILIVFVYTIILWLRQIWNAFKWNKLIENVSIRVMSRNLWFNKYTTGVLIIFYISSHIF